MQSLDQLQKLNLSKIKDSTQLMNYIIKHSKSPMNVNCDKCNISRLFLPEESRYVCTNCGETEYILTNIANYSDKFHFKKYFPYTRITYLKEILNRLQSKET